MIHNITFKNITAVSAPGDTSPVIELTGIDADHLIDGVQFDNIVLDGRVLGPEDVTKNDFVKNVEFE